MGISATRHSFSNNETDVGTLDLKSTKGNGVYTASSPGTGSPAGASGTSSAFGGASGGGGNLNALAKGINSAAASVAGMSDSALKTVGKTLDGVVGGLMNSKLGPLADCVLGGLLGINIEGVRDFLKGVIKGGTKFVCNNLDMLKDLTKGRSLPKPILEGLLLGLALDWLDLVCKPFSQTEWSKLGNRDLLSVSFCGFNYSNSGVGGGSDYLTKFCKAAKSLVEREEGISGDSVPAPNQIVDAILNQNWKVNTKTMNFPNSVKRDLSEAIDNSLINYPSGGSEFSKLLKARGDIINAPTTATNQKKLDTATSNAKQSFGSMLQSLSKTDLDALYRPSLSSHGKTLLENMKAIKDLVANDSDLQGRSTKKGSFETYNFTPVLNLLDKPSLLNHDCGGIDSGNHDDLGLNPTTASMISNKAVKPAVKNTSTAAPAKSKNKTSFGKQVVTLATKAIGAVI